jgi:transglutaminase-like putative cysteine protease
MIRKTLIYFIAVSIGLVMVCAFQFSCAFAGENIIDKKNENPLSRNIQYNFKIQNTTNRLLSRADFWTYVPVKNNSLQESISLESSHPYQLITDQQGNQIIHFTFLNIAPFSSSMVTVKTKLLMHKNPRTLSINNMQPYLEPGKYIESDDPEIKKIAQHLKGKTARETAEKIFNWINANIIYDAYSSYDHGALHALKQRKGDCTEFAYLFVALCRSNGIPARAIGGYICPDSMILSANKFHNWAEVHLGNTWQIVDPQKKKFLRDQVNYVAVEIINHKNENPMGNYHRFRFEGEGFTVKMN